MTTDMLPIELSAVETGGVDPAGPRGGARILTVYDVMARDPAVVHAHASLFSAWAVMHDGQHRHLVVIDDDVRPIGVVDELDIAEEWPVGLRAPHHMPIHQLLRSRPRPQVQATDDIVAAARSMRGAQVDAVPVVDADGRLQGLLTAWHFVWLVAGGPGGVEPDARSPERPTATSARHDDDERDASVPSGPASVNTVPSHGEPAVLARDTGTGGPRGRTRYSQPGRAP
jgi:CBS domain-containing protein